MDAQPVSQEKSMRRATIKDVAERAKVSLKTVSRVINNEPSVMQATRARVLRAIAELDYEPDPAARNLRTGTTLVIGLVYDNPNHSAIHFQRNHDFCIAGCVTGDVPRESVHVFYPLHLLLRYRRTAYAFAHRNTHAGDFALERPQHQRIGFGQQIESCPVHALQAFK